MKKLLSTVLAVIIMLSAVAIMPSAVSAATKTNKTFYPVSRSICSNSYGYVTVDRTNLILIKNSDSYLNSIVNFIKITPDKGYNSTENTSFFMRGKTVIYNDGKTTYSVGLDGKNRKKLTKNIENKLIGGYGSDAIVYENISKKINVYKASPAGKMTKLVKFSDKGGKLDLFGSKVYYTPYNKGKIHVYNLKTNKTTAVSRIDSLTYGKKKMYYIDKNNKLIRVDLNGKKKTVAKNVYNILDVNNGSTVLYSKLDKSQNVTYYRQTGDKKEKKVCTFQKLAKKVVSVFNEHRYGHCNYKIKIDDLRANNVIAKITSKEIAFIVGTDVYHTKMIFSTGLNGGNMRVRECGECYETDDIYCNYYNYEVAVGDIMACRTYVGSDAEVFYTGSKFFDLGEYVENLNFPKVFLK